MEEINNSTVKSLLELKVQAELLDSLATASTVSLAENTVVKKVTKSNKITRSRQLWEYFDESMSRGRKLKFFIFACAALVISCLNFIVTGLLYNSNWDYDSTLEKNIKSLHEYHSEIGQSFKLCMNNITRIQDDIQFVKEANLRVQSSWEEVTGSLGERLENLTEEIDDIGAQVGMNDYRFGYMKQDFKNNRSSLQAQLMGLTAANKLVNSRFENFRDYAKSKEDDFYTTIDALMLKNDNLTEIVSDNENKIEKVENDIETALLNLTDIIESDCGGIIRIPTTKDSYLLQYKLHNVYHSNENCLWTVENTKNSIRSQLTLKVELISHGFKGKTGLYAFKWNRNTSLSSVKITSGKKHELSAEGLYISFTSGSGHEEFRLGSGFLLRIIVTQSEIKTEGLNVFYRASVGRHTELGYKNGDQISIVVNPKDTLMFNVDSVYTEKHHDFLTVYEIQAHGGFYESARISGNEQNMRSVQIRSEGAVLCIFSSDFSNTFGGFQISWTAYQE